MPKFTYIARDTKGERIEGALEVEDHQAVVARLQTMGFFPVRIEEVAAKRRMSLSLSGFRGKARTADVANFLRQLADLVAAGVPLVKSLDIILSQTRGELMREIISEVSKTVQGGDTLWQALQRHPKVFTPLNVAMVRAGESGGMLHDVLQRLANFSEAEEELKGKVLSALAYPAIMVVAGSVIIMILVTVVIPKITRVFADMGQTLPGITLLLMAITDFIRNFKWFLLLGAVVAAVLLNRSVKSKEGRTIFDRFRLAIPILGNLIHKRDLARFSRTLGNLLRNGVPILTALEIAQEVVSNVIIRREVEKLPGAISQGTSMAASLSDSPHFPSFMVSMIAIGEETAQLDGVLLRIAETYESQVDRSVKTLTSVLEPLIILALGVVVGFIVIAMMLPIMTLDPMQGGE